MSPQVHKEMVEPTYPTRHMYVKQPNGSWDRDPLISEQTYVLTQDEWYACVWKPHALGTDRELVRDGAKLAGWGRWFGNLSQDEVDDLLRMLSLGDARLTDEERLRLRDYHGLVPYTTDRIPFLDLDVNVAHPDFTPELAQETARAYAVALTRACEDVGLGTPAWALSNVEGGMHGRVCFEEGLDPSPVMPYAVLRLVRAAAAQAGVPTLMQSTEKPLVGLDDGLFNRSVYTRGDVWRLEGQAKPGKIYQPLWLNMRAPTPTWSNSNHWCDPFPGHPKALDDAIRDEEALAREREKAEALRIAELEKRRKEVIELRRKRGPIDRGSAPAIPEVWPARYVQVVVDRRIEDMRLATPGNRNATLNKAAYFFGGLESGGAFDGGAVSAHDAREALVYAAVQAGGHDEEQIRSVLTIAWRSGASRPVSPPEPKEPPRKIAATPHQAHAPDPCNPPSSALKDQLRWLEGLRPTVAVLLAREKPPEANDGVSPNTGETALALSGWICERRLNVELAIATLEIIGLPGARAIVASTYDKLLNNKPIRGARALDKLLSLAGYAKAEGRAWRESLHKLETFQFFNELVTPRESAARKKEKEEIRARRRSSAAFAEVFLQQEELAARDEAEPLDPLVADGLKRVSKQFACCELYARQGCGRANACEFERRSKSKRYGSHVPCNDRACPVCRKHDRGARKRYAIAAALARMKQDKAEGRETRMFYVVTLLLKKHVVDPEYYRRIWNAMQECMAYPKNLACHAVPGCMNFIVEARASTVHSAGIFKRNSSYSDDCEEVEISDPLSHVDAVRFSFKDPNSALDQYYQGLYALLPSAEGKDTPKGTAAIERFLLAMAEDPWRNHRFAYHLGEDGAWFLELPSKGALRAQKRADADATAGLVSSAEVECECGQPLVWNAFNEDGSRLIASNLDYFPTINDSVTWLRQDRLVRASAPAVPAPSG